MSGCICLGKSSKATSRLSEAFRSRSVLKKYKAAVRGEVSETKSLTQTMTVGKGRRGLTKESFDSNAREAVLMYEPIAMIQDLTTKQPCTLLDITLVTGLKHYLGPFEAYALSKPDTPFREEQERLPYENFYYDQEDILFESASRAGFSWSVHRPHTIIGWAIGNCMNMGVTLAVYATICRETGRPFVFPGSPEQYEAATDVTDARILTRQLIWAATEPAAENPALNIVNGDIFRWRRMWTIIGNDLGVEPAPYPGEPTPLTEQMKDAGPIWDGIVEKYQLQPHSIETLASWWHSDADLGRRIETFTDMSKSRRLGFLDYQETSNSFLNLFDRLRRERIIPPR